MGFVLKEQSGAELSRALLQVNRGKLYVASQSEKHLPWARSLRPLKGEDQASNLTPRQREVLRLISEGKTTKE